MEGNLRIGVNRFVFYLLLFFLAIFASVYILFNFFPLKPQGIVKVGILHSFTGTMAVSEKSVAAVEILAIEEINKNGGVLGKKIVPVVADGQSDPDIFAQEAERLIVKEKVAAIFGCWTSASRKSVKTVVEKYDSLLFYPVQYEGLEKSRNIVYLGSTINQQLIPAVKWSCENLGRKIFLVGSDYVFPRVANDVAKNIAGYFTASIVGEEYVPLGWQDFSDIIKKIKNSGADVVLNSLNGSSNIVFLNALCREELLGRQVKVVSLSFSENELKETIEHCALGDRDFLKKNIGNIYACWSYFSSLDTPENHQFVNKFKTRYGANSFVTDPMEAAYTGVYLWRQAVQDCGGFFYIPSILSHLHYSSVLAPGGIFSIVQNGHAIKYARIGQAQENGSFGILWSSDMQIYPEPYPYFRDREYWDGLLNRIYEGYHGAWSVHRSPLVKEDVL